MKMINKMNKMICRGRDLHSEIWYKGFYVYYYNDITNEDKAFILTYDGDSGVTGDGWFKWHIVDPTTVGRYIGQQDAYGTEIFEGDIIKYDDYYGVVLFDNDDAQYMIRFTNGEREYFCNMCSADCEVCGNIYDDPEWEFGTGNK